MQEEVCHDFFFQGFDLRSCVSRGALTKLQVTAEAGQYLCRLHVQMPSPLSTSLVKNPSYPSMRHAKASSNGPHGRWKGISIGRKSPVRGLRSWMASCLRRTVSVDCTRTWKGFPRPAVKRFLDLMLGFLGTNKMRI